MKRILLLLMAMAKLSAGPVEAQLASAADHDWPRVMPCRIHDGGNQDLFVMTLGRVQTPIADGVFDPVEDEVTLKGGKVILNYYRDVLGVKFYQPLDKTHFPLPPSGWCTWYYYYNRVNETEVKHNALWLAENLRDYGAKYVQIDNGWEGADGRDGQRDWSTVNHQRFLGGLAALAAYIKSLGLEPGLWLAPQGQSNAKVVAQNPAVFLLKPDGTTASDTWEGKFLLDPTAPESSVYLKDLFTKLTGWGFDYFKIDGQPIVVDEYAAKKQFMKHPSGDAAGLYRRTLADIRGAIGPERYLLGCWGIPLEGAGIMNGSRTGGDVVLGWDGFQLALRPTMDAYYLHNIVWYSDPDVLLVRPPLTLDQARVWATLEGLTGQTLMSSDRLADLPADRVELLRRVFPATNIRPLDLFPAGRNKRIWDLKVNHLGRNYDVVGVFNFHSGKAEQILLNWKDLGLPDDRPVHVYDFWNQEYLGDWPAGMAVDTAPTSCHVLTLLPDNGRIQLISTSRHITQGWVDLTALSQNDAGDTFEGRSKVVENDPYELRFVFPRGTNYQVTSVEAHAGWHHLPVQISNHSGWATVRVTPSKTGEIAWSVKFAPSDAFHFPPGPPADPWLERIGLDGVNLHWQEQYHPNDGYVVYLNGRLMGYTPNAGFPLRGLDPQANYMVEVKSVAEDGWESAKGVELKFSVAALIPGRLPLNELDPVYSTGDWHGFKIVKIGDQLTGAPLLLGGTRHESGLATFAGSETEFDLKGLYNKFTALAGVDAESANQATADFIVLGDGRELWRSGVMKKTDAPKIVEADLTGIHKLVLRTIGNNGDGNRSQADWAEPFLSKSGY